MKFLMLINNDPSYFATATQEEQGAHFGAYMAFNERTGGAGQLLGGHMFGPLEEVATVRVRGGQTSVTDGPFVESKELLGGYYLIEATDRDEAIALAAQIPGAEIGSINVLPLQVPTQG